MHALLYIKTEHNVIKIQHNGSFNKYSVHDNTMTNPLKPRDNYVYHRPLQLIHLLHFIFMGFVRFSL
jgi:hypothetical protein